MSIIPTSKPEVCTLWTLCLLIWSGLFAGCQLVDTENSVIEDSAWNVNNSTQAVMKSVATYRLQRMGGATGGSRTWQDCTLFTGMIAAYEATQAPAYLQAVNDWGQANGWALGPRERHADDHCVGQVYLDVYRLTGEQRHLRATQEAFDRVLQDRRTGREEWHWCDALFMAPPALARLAAVTNEQKYWDLLSDYYWDANEYLYDEDRNLYYRDANFFSYRSPNGTPVFWARGNAWVLAGLSRVLQVMPRDNPDHKRFVHHFRELADAVVQQQQEDGLWRPNLLDEDAYPSPETSSTGLFAYALAWGVNARYLDSASYQPPALRAWEGLVRSVNDEGRLGWVQPVGAKPEPVSRDDESSYGDGAFLLAGSEILRLRSSP